MNRIGASDAASSGTYRGDPVASALRARALNRRPAPPRRLRENMGAYLRLLNRFLRPSWRLLLVMVVVNLVGTTLISLRFLAMTPAIETVVANHQAPAAGLTDLTLNNLGPTLRQLFQIDPNDKTRALAVAAAVFFSIHVLGAGLELLGYGLLLIVRRRVREDMTVWIHRHLMSLPLSYFIRNSTGDLTSRACNDVNATGSSLDTVTKALLQSGFQIVLYAVILLRTDPAMTGMIALLGTVHILVARVLSPMVYRRGKEIQQQTGLMQQSLLESYQAIRLLKSFAAERFDVQRISEIIGYVGRRFTRCRFVMHLEVPARMVIDGFVVAVLLVVSFRFAVLQGTMEISAIALFLGLAMQLVNPISQLSSHFIQLNALMGAASRIEEVMDARDALPDGALTAQPLRDSIEFRRVSFEYEPGRLVLHDINLSIPKGGMVAVVGPSGGGKTTLTDLLLRLYDPTSGQILYDGTDVREFRQRTYRRLFGVVAQESLLMNGTVGYNITFGRPVDEACLWEAARVANAEGFIRDLPEGMETPVGDRGIRLSGGQRQRIAIARAVYAHPALLVLDEATSALDTESERDVQAALANVTSRMTSIVIAHRLATILHANQVVVLDQGRIVAVGTHAELLNTCPLYQRLYYLQFEPPASADGGRDDNRSAPEPEAEPDSGMAHGFDERDGP